MGAFGGEAGGGVFGFAQDVGRFVFAANVGEALEFAGAGGGEEDFAAVGELGFHVGHAGDGRRRGSERWGVKRVQIAEPPAVPTSSCSRLICEPFRKAAENCRFGPEIMIGGGSVGLAVALVVFDGACEMFRGDFAKGLRFVEENNRTERTLREFEQGGGARLRRDGPKNEGVSQADSSCAQRW